MLIQLDPTRKLSKRYSSDVSLYQNVDRLYLQKRFAGGGFGSFFRTIYKKGKKLYKQGKKLYKKAEHFVNKTPVGRVLYNTAKQATPFIGMAETAYNLGKDVYETGESIYNQLNGLKNRSVQKKQLIEQQWADRDINQDKIKQSLVSNTIKEVMSGSGTRRIKRKTKTKKTRQSKKAKGGYIVPVNMLKDYNPYNQIYQPLVNTRPIPQMKQLLTEKQLRKLLKSI